MQSVSLKKFFSIFILHNPTLCKQSWFGLFWTHIQARDFQCSFLIFWITTIWHWEKNIFPNPLTVTASGSNCYNCQPFPTWHQGWPTINFHFSIFYILHIAFHLYKFFSIINISQSSQWCGAVIIHRYSVKNFVHKISRDDSCHPLHTLVPPKQSIVGRQSKHIADRYALKLGTSRLSKMLFGLLR